MGKTTILEFMTEYPKTDNVKFVAGINELRLTRGSDGNVNVIHNLNNGSWTTLSSADYIDLSTHFTDKGHISNVELSDANENLIIEITTPQLIIF